LSACPQCGQKNKEGAKFCIKCGASLEAPAQTAAPPPAPPPQAAQPTYQQPAQYQQPTPPPGAYQQQAYAAPPAAPYPAAYAPAPAYAAKTRSGLFWVGALIVLVSGIFVLVSTWMSWGSGPGGFLSLSGWDWFDIGKAGGGGSGEVVNAFFVYSDGYPIFTGLCSLILGGLIALIAVLMLLFRSKGLGGMAILFSIFALGMAITNLTTILRTEGISVGVGIYIFLIFSFTGLVGGGMSMSG
jgi:hypothetical protein